MTRRKVPPSRMRYEASHPSLTVRLPAEVKVKVQEAARAEGLSVSEWVQATAAGHTAEIAGAYRRGQEEGERAGEVRGYARGLDAGRRAGELAGYRAGLLAYGLALERGGAFASPSSRRRCWPRLAKRRQWKRSSGRRASELPGGASCSRSSGNREGPADGAQSLVPQGLQVTGPAVEGMCFPYPPNRPRCTP